MNLLLIHFFPSSHGFSHLSLLHQGRIYVPYGPDLIANPPQSSSEQPWKGMGFGMGATEHWAYDYVEGYIYSHSEAGGFITVIDYSKAAFPGKVSDFSFDVGGRNVKSAILLFVLRRA